MDENVGLLARMFGGEGREKFLSCAVGCNVKRIEPSDGRKLVFQFEHTAHESLLVPQIQGDTSSGQLLANGPSDGVLAGNTKHKGRFTL